VTEARFVAPTSGYLPRLAGSQLCCGRCGGQLYLDDVEPLGRSVPLEEVGGLSFGRVLAGEALSVDSAIA
jgi:hypothetical protein